MGFVGCNLNPDPSGGYFSDPPLGDRHWYPLYEAIVELDVPAMIHVSQACNPHVYTTGSHYLGADTTAFQQLLMSKVFIDLLLRVIPADNVLFASEMVGAVRGVDPTTGHSYDDTRRYVDAAAVSAADRTMIYEANTRRVFPRLAART